MKIRVFPAFTEKVSLRILSLSVALYVLVFFSWCYLKYDQFLYNDFDLAVHDQIIWNILHGSLFNSILGIDFLGNHVHFISFLIAPVYWFFSHPLSLLFLQTIFLAGGAYPLYGLARIYLDHRLSLMVCIVYLLYPGLGFTNLYEFHPTCFAPFLLLCAAYFFYKEKFIPFNVFMFLSLLCQENIALIFLMWGIYAFFLKRRLKWVLVPSLIGLIYFLLCVYIILPHFNKGVFDFFAIYSPLGDSLGEVLQNCLLHPLFVIMILFKPVKIDYLLKLFVSVLFIPLLSPLALLPILLIFLQHLLSSRPADISLHYHYTAELIPFIFVAFVFGIKKIINFDAKYRLLSFIFLLNALMIYLLMGPNFGDLAREWKALKVDHKTSQNEELIKQIPSDASVVSTFGFLSHLAHRMELYSFHYVYTGFYTLSNKPFHLPDNVQYALIDFDDLRTFVAFYRINNYRNINNFLKQGSWGSMKVEDSTVLFKKGIKNKYPLFDLMDHPVAMSHSVHWTIDNRIELNGYDVLKRSESIHLVFYWKLLQPEEKDVNLFIDFIDEKGRSIDRQSRPLCYRIWPTQAWQKGQFIVEHQYISIPPGLIGRLRSLKVGFFNFNTGKLIRTDSKDPLGRINLDLAR